MKLNELFNLSDGYQIIGNHSVEIKGISSHSQGVKPGDLFIALQGQSHDARLYIQQALDAGAVAIATHQVMPQFSACPQIIHSQIQTKIPEIAAKFYGFPSNQLTVVGITGTNGKTTTSFLVRHLLEELKKPCGLIGTIENIIGDQSYPATRTTPDAVSNQRLLAEMINVNCTAAVMEVTSHALVQNRVALIDFDVAIFTNLTQDHLDYHGTMEQYCLAKNRLFRDLSSQPSQKNKWAIVNADDKWTDAILESCKAPIFTYSIDKPSDLQATNIILATSHTQFTLHYKNRAYACHLPLVGRYNIYNALAAMSAGIVLGFPIETILKIAVNFPSVKGRIAPVRNPLGLNVYVDYAHTDDALINILGTLKEINPRGRLLVLFGCGGNRDRTKRPKMARAAEQFADFCLITSDNPRNEDPKVICDEIVSGFSTAANYQIEIDRYTAIKKLLEMATPNDSVLIAGKGHENSQTFANYEIPFDDTLITINICEDIKHLRLVESTKCQSHSIEA